MKVVIIGGGSAGTTCAFEIRKLNKNAEITIIESSNNTQYSPCALPYIISGEITEIENIFVFKEKDYKNNDIKLMLNTKAEEVDVKNKTVLCKQKYVEEIKKIEYDKLVLAMGGTCFVPEIKGIKETKYYMLKNIDDAKNIMEKIKPKTKSVVLGAGFVGVELAVALAKKNEEVVLIEADKYILKGMFDEDIAREIKNDLEDLKIKVIEDVKISEIKENQILLEKEKIEFEKLFVCTGIKPNLKIAEMINLKIGKGIEVDEYMQTSEQNIYACGDNVESIGLINNQKVMSQLGTTAVRQAKIVAGNISGSNEKIMPVINTTITKLNNLYAGCVGINTKTAENMDIKVVSAKYKGNVRSEYYPSESKITIKIICDIKGKIIGGQIIGHEEVVGRINLLALAIQQEINVEELMKLETCYNPASAPIFDPITITAQICHKKLSFLQKKL